MLVKRNRKTLPQSFCPTRFDFENTILQVSKQNLEVRARRAEILRINLAQATLHAPPPLGRNGSQ